MTWRPSGTALFWLSHGGLLLWTLLVIYIAVVTKDEGYITLWWLPLVLWLAIDLWVNRDKDA